MDECARFFELPRDMGRLKAKMRKAVAEKKPVDFNAMSMAVMRYAQCRTFLERSADSCQILAGMEGWGNPQRNQGLCQAMFERSFLWRDINYSSRLDELDESACRNILGGEVLDPVVFCRKFHELWRQRKPAENVLEELRPLILPKRQKVWLDVISRVSAPTFRARPGEPEPMMLNRFFLNRMWNASPLVCEAEPLLKNVSPIVTALNQGACAGMLEVNGCEKLLTPVKSFYCQGH
jgi:hypothetical protein